MSFKDKKEAEDYLKRIISKYYGAGWNRELKYACLKANYGSLSAILFQLEGSPPRGTLIALYGESSFDPPVFYVYNTNYYPARFTIIQKDGYSKMWREIKEAIEVYLSEEVISDGSPSHNRPMDLS